ncbi:uncharacterized protein SPPG_05048 [Spizellomyces punctatus DAOM BR117]|uniref:Uncharacterized protein n=1 Tax=Spizellomyces punctatus (strain DAOM BR117) TaxID=645134 RepID=A0A0L0HEZ6_SPIPD|nr:uncharacterized protein SPPG_05048 [Spizellomyces punctatus DAOM BR117]KNC99667.1 hypothetical protein SPPG_05048 [Spizellomyces punctatus DAOM BR117]|eukprot:XP_016607707.1 hypothetical protein SPPG_05048 [Spizellomyces punctatus DAOM BR117]
MGVAAPQLIYWWRYRSLPFPHWLGPPQVVRGTLKSNAPIAILRTGFFGRGNPIGGVGHAIRASRVRFGLTRDLSKTSSSLQTAVFPPLKSEGGLTTKSIIHVGESGKLINRISNVLEPLQDLDLAIEGSSIVRVLPRMESGQARSPNLEDVHMTPFNAGVLEPGEGGRRGNPTYFPPTGIPPAEQVSAGESGSFMPRALRQFWDGDVAHKDPPEGDSETKASQWVLDIEKDIVDDLSGQAR